jgi:hypothetical protein
MAVPDAIWRGQIAQQITDHERRIENVEEDLRTVRDQMIAAHARMALITGICSVLGAGGGVWLFTHIH